MHGKWKDLISVVHRLQVGQIIYRLRYIKNNNEEESSLRNLGNNKKYIISEFQKIPVQFRFVSDVET